MIKPQLEKAFQQYVSSRWYKNLADSYGEKTFKQQYYPFFITVLMLSYLFNLLSLASGAYALYDLTNMFIQNMAISIVICSILLLAMEQVKRYSSTALWRGWWRYNKLIRGWLILSLTIAVASIAASMYGSHEGTEDLGPSADLIAQDSAAIAYRDRIAELEAENKRHESNKNSKGETYWPSQQAIEKNKGIIAQLEQRALDLDVKLEGHNEVLSADHRKKIALTAITLMWLALVFEFLFEACVGYIEYYRNRCFHEWWIGQGFPITNTGQLILSYLEQVEEHEKQEYEQYRLYKPKKIHKRTYSPAPQPANPGQDMFKRFKEQIEELTKFFNSVQQPVFENESKETQGDEDLPEEEVRTKIPFFGQKPEPSIPKIITKLDDINTVPHIYIRNGQPVTTHYGEALIRSRINQYARLITEIKDKDLIPENRLLKKKNILSYWEDKMIELHEKQVRAGCRQVSTVYVRGSVV